MRRRSRPETGARTIASTVASWRHSMHRSRAPTNTRGMKRSLGGTSRVVPAVDPTAGSHVGSGTRLVRGACEQFSFRIVSSHMLATNIWFWVGFIGFVLTMLALDLGVFHREAHEVRPKEAGIWTAVWVALALLFAGGLYLLSGRHVALTFLTGYVVEEALSADNIFVMVLIFEYFRVPKASQHRVLFYGILGALVMRGLFIGVGAALIAAFHWILYVFGAMLIVTGIRMGIKSDEEFDGEQNRIVRAARRLLPFSKDFHANH